MSLTTQDVRDLFEEAKRNAATLAACPGHRFDVEPRATLGIKPLVCTVCGGSMSRGDVLTYATGYAAAGGNKAEVWPQLWGQR